MVSWTKTRVLVILATVSLSACAGAPKQFESDFQPVLPPLVEPTFTPTGSLYMAGGTDWFGRERARQVGDSVTVLLQEEVSAGQSQSISTNRQSDNNLFNADAIGGPPWLNAENFWGGSTLSSTGSGETGQSATMSGSITATVIEVYANGSMLVQGEKILSMTDGSERIRLRGIIRPGDISPNNTVLSYRLSNAQISYEGTGSLTRASRPGWGTRILQNVWPF